MDRRLTAILAGASLLGAEAAGEIDKFDLRWVVAAPHNHVEIPENIAVDISSAISASGQPVALRATLKKDGSPDIRFELHRDSSSDLSFFTVEDGIPTGVFWIELTPQQAMSGEPPNITLRDAWQRCLAKRFPGHTVTALEEGTRRVL